ncbi:MAG: hypothetical protein IJE02_05755 [Clostridia bacterium]|nr:hypothetical protein [Clostridia bacterium]
MDRKKIHKYAFVGVCIIVIIVIVILSLRGCNGTTPNDNNNSSDTTSDKVLDFTPAEERKSIQIPAVTGIYMRAGQLNQTVDFYNPKENNCYFVISLYLSDDTLIYKSDMIAPAEYIKEITLLQELKRGIYRNCRLVYNCYSLDNKTQLNGSNVVLEINAQ